MISNGNTPMEMAAVEPVASDTNAADTNAADTNAAFEQAPADSSNAALEIGATTMTACWCCARG